MRLPEVRRAIFNDLTARTGYTFDETPDSFTGQFVSIFAEREAALWELAEQAYLSSFPVTATGIPLDLAVSYAGVRRLQPARSRANAELIGDPGTVVPAGTIVQGTQAYDTTDVPPRFTLETQVTISKAAVVGASLSVPNVVVPGQTYWISINAQRYNVVAVTNQTGAQVASALGNLIGASLATVADTSIKLYNQVPYAVDWSNNINSSGITCPGVLISENFGAVLAPTNTLTRIISSVSGLSSITNIAAALPGQVLETDEQLRVRYALGVFRLGAGTVPSIYANLIQNVSGITTARVFENTTDQTDGDGRPPHSIEAVIEGGDNSTIFQQIHLLKPAGIAAYGNTSGFVRAADGYQHPVAFSRPELRWIWIRVQFATTLEESVPGDIGARIASAVAAAGNKLSPGQDVFLQRLAAAPFAVTSGLAKVTLTAAMTNAGAPQPTVFSATDIAIGPRQKAVFDVSRIFIV